MDLVLTIHPLIQHCHSSLGWILLPGLICYQMISFQEECLISRSRNIWKYPLLLLFLTDTWAQEAEVDADQWKYFRILPACLCSSMWPGSLSEQWGMSRALLGGVLVLGNISFLWLEDRRGLPGLALFILPGHKVMPSFGRQLANAIGAWIGSPQCHFRFLLFRKVRRAETIFCRIARS